MPSFILRDIEPTFWARVQAKAKAEGVPVKALILRLLAQWLAAVSLIVTAACAADTPLQPSAKLPEKGAPATLELNAIVATGTNGGTATVTARVLDPFGTVVAGLPVAFSASSGTFSEASVPTSDKGIASTILTADPGTVTITAKVATVQNQTTVSVQPRIVAPVPPVSQPPAPLPGPPAPGPFSVSLSASTVQIGAATFLLANIGGSTAPVRVSWDFGDGGTFTSTSTGPPQASTTHVYGSTGSFHATIVVSDAAGHSGSASADAQVVAGPPPTLSVTLAASPASVPAFTAMTLTATATATNGAAAVSSYTIDCGDGTAPVTTASKMRTCAGYSTPGAKVASVTATNGTQTANATTTINVTAAPVPTIKVNCGDAILPAASTCNVSATLGTTPIGASQITITDWEWGDGLRGANGTGTGFVSQSHTFGGPSGAPGYTVVVTASVPNGGGLGTGSGSAVVK